MSSTPFFKELLCLAIQMAETLSERIPKSGPLQSDCKHTATSLRTWRKKLPSDMEFLLRSTGDKSLYHAILLPLSDLLCILCMSSLRTPSQTLTSARPTHLDGSRARPPPSIGNPHPRQRRGAEDQKRIALNQEVHGRPVRHLSQILSPYSRPAFLLARHAAQANPPCQSLTPQPHLMTQTPSSSSK